MAQCQIEPASAYAFPRGPAPVEDRQMSLAGRCRESATYSANLRGAARARGANASTAREFVLCENHSQLVAQVDRELVEEGWSSVLVERPQFLP
ncbi:MAG TPA: hypothetical protein VGP88_06295 [Thermoplasmata archaeon]|jgi:hypothetical protein|nr:hypothetical protein [Thermoplasmata archaeon]